MWNEAWKKKAWLRRPTWQVVYVDKIPRPVCEGEERGARPFGRIVSRRESKET